MKRSLVAGAAAVLAAVVIPAGAAAYALSDELLEVLAAAPASRGIAVGEGNFSKGQPSDRFHVAAHGTPADARGSVRLNQEGFAEVRGRVDCVFVFGALAGVAGTLEQPVGPAGELSYFALALVDNGEPGGATPDMAIYEARNVPAWGGDCGLVALLSLGAPPILQGNVVVKTK
jgi:hypothetical protein